MRTSASIASVLAVAVLGCSPGSGALGSGRRSSACQQLRIGVHRQCLAAGQPCRPRYERQYERHGFRCKRNSAGEYRLWTPLKPGRPRP